MKKHFTSIAVLLFLISHSSFSDAPQESALGATKAAYFLQQIETTAYGTKLPPISSPSTWSKLSLLSASYNANAFSHNGDVMPEGRQKLIHSFGTTALVSLVVLPNHPYTGLFATGAPHGILRISLATQPGDDVPKKLIPGLALKFFIDGSASLNIMAMPSLDGQTTSNIFEFAYTTDLKPPTWSIAGSLLENRFRASLWYVGQNGGNPRSFSLNHFSAQTSMGAAVSTPVAPYSIELVPTVDLYRLGTPNKDEDFRVSLEGKGLGEVLFEVVAKGRADQAPVRIGFIVAESNFVASSFGDEKLFFKHAPVRMDPTGKDEF